MAEKRINEEKIRFIVDNYAEMENSLIAAAIGMSMRSVERYAYLNGCHKSRAFRIRQGKAIRQRTKDDVYKEMVKRRAETFREVYRKERRRVLFGLEQKTRLRVTRYSMERTRLRQNLRRHDYIIEYGLDDIYITSETKRSERLERRAEKMGMQLIIEEEENYV